MVIVYYPRQKNPLYTSNTSRRRWTVSVGLIPCGTRVPSTGRNINLWPGDLLSCTLFQMSATVRQPNSITYRRETACKHTHTHTFLLSLGCTHTYTHTLRWSSAGSLVNHISDIPQVSSIVCYRCERSQFTELFQLFDTVVSVGVSFSCTSVKPLINTVSIDYWLLG